MSTNHNHNNGPDSASNAAGQKVPVTTTQTSGSVSTTLTTTARTLTQPPTLPHIVGDNARMSQSPSNSVNNMNINADSSTSQRTNTSSAPSGPFLSQKTRKLVPRSRMENEERQAKATPSPAAAAAVQQGQVVAATSSPGNNTYVIRDNEGRWFLLQTNAGAGTPVHQSDACNRVALQGWRNVPSASATGQLPELQQNFTKPAMQPQQLQHNQIQQLQPQLIKSNLLSGNATLGQLARSLAPKPAHSTGAVSNAPSSMISTQSGAMPQQSTPRPALHQPNTSPVTQTQASVVGHYPAIRPSANQNAQLVTMINGYYVQSLPPNVSVPPSLPQQGTLVSQAKVAASVTQHGSGSNQPAQSHLRLHSAPSGAPNVKQVPQVGNQLQISSAAAQSLEKVHQAKSSESGRPISTSTTALPASHIQNMVPSAVGTIAAPAGTYILGNNKLSPCAKGRGIDDKLQRAGAVASPVAPSGIMPHGTQVMLMPNGTISQSGAISASGTPLIYSGGQGIRQQLVPTSSLPGQVLPVFQQQQNLPRFASTPTSQPPGAGLFRRRPDGDTESGVENEPPSIECHGESKEAHRVRLMFLREAEAFREQLGSEDQIVHSIDGIEILESGTPFPSAPPVPLEEWMPRGPREAATNSELRSSGMKEDNNLEEEKPMDTDVVSLEFMNKSTQKDNYATPRKKAVKSPATSSGSPEKTPLGSKKHRKRRTNEVDKLLQMDFGPSQGRLRDILQNSEHSVEKKEGSKQARASSDEEESGAVSVPTHESPADHLEGPSEEKTQDQIPPYKEKKRRGRIPGKKNIKGAGEKQTGLITKESTTAKTEDQSKEETVIGNVSVVGGKNMMEESGTTDQQNEVANAAESSLNSSVESAVDLGVSVGNISLSDEDLDTERCIYCDGFLRVKRLVSHPQYCSKKCRKLWKKNPLLSGTRPADSTTPQSSFNSSANAATSSTAAPAIVLQSPNNSAPVSPEVQPRPARPLPTLVLRMGLPANNPEAVKSAALTKSQEINVAAESHLSSTQKSATRAYLPSAQPFPIRTPQTPETQAIVQNPCVSTAHVSTGYASPVPTPPSTKALEPKEKAEFPEGHPRTWTCDEVASWVTRITGADAIGEKFRNQDVDGQSLLLMAESEEGIAALLTQKLHLKLGPVLKLEKALKDLIVRSTES